MASRKDFASKKRSASKPASAKRPVKKPKAQTAPIQKKAAPAQTQATHSNTEQKKPWKLILTSLVSLGVIGFLLVQLTKVDPREIRESGISAIIDSAGTSTAPNQPIPNNIASGKTQSKPVTNNTQKKPLSQPKSTTSTTAKVPVTEKSTQAKQKEPYQFYKILAENSVETETIEAYKSTPKTANLNNKTLLQTGSFRNAKDAERMKVKLILNNFPKVAVSKSTSTSGAIWYRVRTGPYVKFNNLKEALTKLNKLNISPLQIPVK
jgi:cell division protein FtsN